jgi:hypothetical protein
VAWLTCGKTTESLPGVADSANPPPISLPEVHVGVSVCISPLVLKAAEATAVVIG